MFWNCRLKVPRKKILPQVQAVEYIILFYNGSRVKTVLIRKRWMCGGGADSLYTTVYEKLEKSVVLLKPKCEIYTLGYLIFLRFINV